MAHRIYLHNINQQKQYYPHYLGEWNYVIPPLLLPLFFAQPKRKGKYLFFNRIQGITYLKHFYDLLAEQYQLNDHQAFNQARNKMFELLEYLPYDDLQMDATDVFNMNEESYTEQAQTWLEDIIEQKVLYDAALEKRDLSVLHEVLAQHRETSFLDILQRDWINYGLGYWNDELYRHDTKPFQDPDSQKWGLKNRHGEVVLQPRFDQIERFNWEGIASVTQEQCYGYIDHQGKILVEPQYIEVSEIFEIEKKQYVIVRTEQEPNKQQLLRIADSEMVFDQSYNCIEHLSYSDTFNVFDQGKYWLYNIHQEKLLDEGADAPFHYDYLRDDYFLLCYNQKDSPKSKYFTPQGFYLGEYIKGSLRYLNAGCFLVELNQYQRKMQVIDEHGTVLLENFDQIKQWTSAGYLSFAYRQAKKWFIYQLEQRQPVLIQGVDKIIDDLYFENMQDIYLIENESQYGLFDATNQQWLIEADGRFNQIKYINSEFFRCVKQKQMYYFNVKTKILSEVFDYIAHGLNIDYFKFGILTLYKENQIFSLNKQRKLYALTSSEIGKLYKQRTSFKDKDLAYFEQFYEYWQQQHQDEYVHFDTDILFDLAQKQQQQGNVEQAIKYYQYAAEKGCSQSMVELGRIYQHDLDMPQKAFQYYQQAADLNDAWGWNNLACLYCSDEGVEQDHQKALDYFKKSIELGSGVAAKNLAIHYENGIIVEKDLILAETLYKQAEKSWVSCAEELANLYYKQEEYEKVLKVIKRNRDDPYTAIYYGIFYEQGQGLKQNIKKAIQHFERALEHALYEYALQQLLYYYGEHEQFKNEKKYQYWLEYQQQQIAE